MLFWIFILIFILTGASSLGIFLSRKNKSIKNFTGKNQTILFLAILSIFVFALDLQRGGDVAHALGYVVGYVYTFTLPCSFLAVFLMNKFKINSKEIWSSWFFSLTLVSIIFVKQSF